MSEIETPLITSVQSFTEVKDLLLALEKFLSKEHSSKS
jgi:hypothetical protein